MGHELPIQHEADAEKALEVLLDAALEPIVDMVLLHRNGAYEALAHDGSVRFRRNDGGGYEVLGTEGVDPLADQGSDKFAGIDAERAHKHPERADNQYPHAFDHIAQLFDSHATPDLCVVHSARHNWEDQGGHLGEHGSLGVVQARAPFVIGGKGVRNLGVAPLSMRLVDVAPTVAALLGCAPIEGGKPLGARAAGERAWSGNAPQFVANQDGEARLDVIDET